MKNTKWIPVLILVLLVGVGIFGGVKLVLDKKVHKEVEIETEKKEAEAEEKEESSDIKSSILGVLREHHIDTSSIVIYNLDTQKEEGFVYGLSTSVKNSFDREIVMKSLPLGSIVELFFKKNGGLLKVMESKEAWDYKGVGNLKILDDGRSMMIGDRQYSYDAGLTVVNGREVGKLSDLLPEKDVLEVKGVEDKILSISVSKGHGSVDFIHYDDFIGGSIEIGYDIFDEVRENMSYVLREGTYKIVMQNGGLIVNKVIDIERNRIRLLDLAQFKDEMEKKSKVNFKLSPAGAVLYLDGREVDGRSSLTLPYGEYLIKVVKDGFLDFEDMIKIEKPKEKIRISLAEAEKDEEEEEDDKKDSERKESGMEEPDEVNESRHGEEIVEREIPIRTDVTGKISFLKPVGATVSLDDKVIGVIPCDTVKVTGEHKITIEKDGFQALSYTVDIEDDGEDAVFSFPELTE